MATFLKQFALGSSLALLTSYVLSDHIQSTSSGLKAELVKIQTDIERIRLGGNLNLFSNSSDFVKELERMERRDLLESVKSNWNEKVIYGVRAVQNVDWTAVGRKSLKSVGEGIAAIQSKLGA